MKNYCSKKEIIRFLKYLKKNSIKVNCEYIEINDIINNNENAYEIYTLIGESLILQKTRYKNILYREELYECIIDKYEINYVKKLINKIRKGKFAEMDHKEMLSKNLIKWAEGVSYLPTRNMFKDLFEEEFKMYRKNNTFLKLSDKELIKEIKQYYVFNNGCSITNVQLEFGIGFARAYRILKMIEYE